MSASASRKSSVPVLSPKLVLPPSFYDRHTVEVAKDLLGKILWVKDRSGISAGRIVETEAYRSDDPASHSARGETPRAAIMFGEPGVAYVYFIYGNYEMLNFVTEPEGRAGAVLVRALEPVAGLEHMARRRNLELTERGRLELARGPGKLCRALGVRMDHNGSRLRGPELFVTDDGFVPEGISVSPRVGIRLGTETLWRFFVTGSPFVSKSPQNAVARPLRPARVSRARRSAARRPSRIEASR
jgi:DNA-3-methyladenine glycosylase